MKKIILTIVLATILVFTMIGCDSSIENSEELTTRITYFKDNDTNLCFGQITSTSYSAYTITSITCVPCDSITNLIK